MKQVFLFIGCTVLVCSSCSTDLGEDLPLMTESSDVARAKDVIPFADIFTIGNTGATATMSDDVIVDFEPVEVTGIDNKEVRKKRTVAMKAAEAAKFGLPQGTYVVETVLCSKTIQLAGKDFWEDDSPECGYKPTKSTSTGLDYDGVSTDRGYAPPESGSNVLRTYVLHVTSDLFGRSYDRYAPCTPDKIT